MVSNAIASVPVDLTPDYTADSSGTDPDVSSGAESVTVISYSDNNQHLSDVRWSITWLGNNDSDDLLEDNEKAEITIWLLNRNNAVASVASASSTTYSISGGMASGATVLAVNTGFPIEMKPPSGVMLSLKRRLPSQLVPVIDLN